jgi:glycerol kinase
VWSDTDELRAAWRADAVFEPRLGTDEREARFARWQRHVAAARDEGTPS